MTDPVSHRPLMPSLMTVYDYIMGRLFARLDGLTREEYLWEPTANSWTVREVDGVWKPDWVRPEPTPVPVTTIAWRMWHIADCVGSYVVEFGGWPLHIDSLGPKGENGATWFGDVEPAVAELRFASDVFVERIKALGEDGLQRPLGSRWGSFAEDSWADLVLHAVDEVAHHGAEIALLRDLYPELSRR